MTVNMKILIFTFLPWIAVAIRKAAVQVEQDDEMHYGIWTVGSTLQYPVQAPGVEQNPHDIMQNKMDMTHQDLMQFPAGMHVYVSFKIGADNSASEVKALWSKLENQHAKMNYQGAVGSVELVGTDRYDQDGVAFQLTAFEDMVQKNNGLEPAFYEDSFQTFKSKLSDLQDERQHPPGWISGGGGPMGPDVVVSGKPVTYTLIQSAPYVGWVMPGGDASPLAMKKYLFPVEISWK